MYFIATPTLKNQNNDFEEINPHIYPFQKKNSICMKRFTEANGSGIAGLSTR
jgi:hypothetical protein